MSNDAVPDPMRTKTSRWWLSNGIHVSWVCALIAVVLEVWSSIDDAENRLHAAQIAGRWALLIALLGGVCFVDIVGQRIIVRLTYVIELFLTDVPPPQPPQHRLDGERAPVVALYQGRGES